MNFVTESHKILARNLAYSGYGESEEVVLAILSRIPEDELEKLTYNLYRTAEKLGEDAFDNKHPFKYDEGEED